MANNLNWMNDDNLNQKNQQEQNVLSTLNQKNPNQFSSWAQNQANPAPRIGTNYNEWAGISGAGNTTLQAPTNGSPGGFRGEAPTAPNQNNGQTGGYTPSYYTPSTYSNAPAMTTPGTNTYSPYPYTTTGAEGSPPLGQYGGVNLFQTMLESGLLSPNAYSTKEARDTNTSLMDNGLFPLAEYMMKGEQANFDKYIQEGDLRRGLSNDAFEQGSTLYNNWLNTEIARDASNIAGAELNLDTWAAEKRYGDQGIERYNTDQNRLGNKEVQNLINSGRYSVQELVNAGLIGQTQEQGAQDYRLQGLRGQQQMAELLKNLDAQNLQSRYLAFGRAQAPNARWSSNW